MRTMLLATLSLSLAACATSPSDAPQPGHGGGKGDDPTAGCPVDGDADAILAAISGGGNCYTAAGIAEACAYGSSLDVQFVGAATEVCGGGFDAIPEGLKTVYDGLLERCGAKYADQEGTLYRSAAAFCQLEVTTLFAELFPAAETSEPAVAYSESCPVAETDPDVIESAIRDAGSCYMASDIAQTCAWGSSIDLQFTAAAAELCTTSVLSEEDAATRDALFAACEDRLADEGGTLGRSIRAYCALHVDVIFDSLYAPVE